MQRLQLLLFALLLSFLPLLAQAPTATIDGRVLDPTKAVIEGVKVDATNIDTSFKYSTQTNSAGLFTLVNLPPGTYRVEVSKTGFRTIVKPDIVLHVQDLVALNFVMPVGSTLESITVEGGASLVNTEDASVSTVVDRNFAENLPMNGRSFQALIELTPGVVLTTVNPVDSGQFSINGQRASSNYWMVDGVSANIGVNTNFLPGSGFAGSVGAFTAQGGTNSLVSVDALQEFRIQTSTYAPEFGRVPGGQISIVTRSGTNRLHGTAFDYFRNGVLDANDWFADASHLAKPQEQQNDFGGTLSGPIIKNRTFFFFSYEGLRLRLPQVTESLVPDVAARLGAISALQPFLNAYPLPNGADQGNGAAEFDSSYSNPATLDAYSLRVDHKVNDKLSLFARYDYSPSRNIVRGGGGLYSLSDLSPIDITTQTGTVGVTWNVHSTVVNDLRFNYSRVSSSSSYQLDSFGGAIPLSTALFPPPYSLQNGLFIFDIFSLPGGDLQVGQNAVNFQRQINLVDTLSAQLGRHSLKFGVDFRRLTPQRTPPQYVQEPFFADVPSAAAGDMFEGIVDSYLRASLLFRNVGVFAQDTWRILPRLTVTYGLRWDIDFAPQTTSGPSFPAANGFDLNDLAGLSPAPNGVPAFKTSYGNVAPRIGVAYQLSQHPNWGNVVRGGVGAFFDLATEQAGNVFQGFYPFGGENFVFGAFPLNSSSAAPPPITPDNLAPPFGTFAAFDPALKLPYTLEWNIAFEQAVGNKQSMSASYIGSAGKRLIQSGLVSAPNANLGNALLITNAARSDYDALQLQFQRRLSHGLQALGSYTWSHSIDDGSAASYANAANTLVPGVSSSANRGPSDFDIRNAFSVGLTYDIPTPQVKALLGAILRGWSTENFITARSAPPVNVFDSTFFGIRGADASVRPDLVPGIPLYLQGRKYPGGKALNNTPDQGGPGCLGPFCPPPTDASGFVPLRQGDLGRNALRGFGAVQWDFAIHRDFPIRELLKLQFRAEMFNVLNHPNFGSPVADINSPFNFGESVQMLGRSLDSGSAGAGLSSLYQIGGPRSIQFALKLLF